MLYVVIFFFLVSIYIYCLLGGADFGAGIIELIEKKQFKERTRNLVSEAMAPIWEANHMWLIIAVVVLFNAFPLVYTQLLVSLSIPLILMLIGIILRGTAFTFRHYDAIKDSSQEMYSKVFEYSSLTVPFFFGLVVGSIISGKIVTNPSSFYEGYINPWLNLFSISTGIFVATLFSFIASVFLTSEIKDKRLLDDFILKSKRSIIVVVVGGLLVFITSLIDRVHFFEDFFSNYSSLALMLIATVCLPLLWKILEKRLKWPSRILVGAQLLFILGAFYMVYFPTLVKLEDGKMLTFYNSAAPEITLTYLGWALIVGSLIIFPALFYLLKVFKTEKKNTVSK
jgi:cytochrome d ubiquinol oxidase subunit II